jgi:uncharacterized protein (TIGR02246 family)
MSPASVADRLAIHDLFVRYATALDEGDVETVVGCFTDDATLESPAIGAISGSEAIRGFARRFAALRRDGTQFRHMITNISIGFDGGGERASATAYLLVMISRYGRHESLPPGRYACDLVKRDGSWRFIRRVVYHDHDYTLDLHPFPAVPPGPEETGGGT